MDFIAFMVDAAQQKDWGLATSQAPANAGVYEDQEMLGAFPFLPQLQGGDRPGQQPAGGGELRRHWRSRKRLTSCTLRETEAEAAMTQLQTQLGRGSRRG